MRVLPRILSFTKKKRARTAHPDVSERAHNKKHHKYISVMPCAFCRVFSVSKKRVRVRARTRFEASQYSYSSLLRSIAHATLIRRRAREFPSPAGVFVSWLVKRRFAPRIAVGSVQNRQRWTPPNAPVKNVQFLPFEPVQLWHFNHLDVLTIFLRFEYFESIRSSFVFSKKKLHFFPSGYLFYRWKNSEIILVHRRNTRLLRNHRSRVFFQWYTWLFNAPTSFSWSQNDDSDGSKL